MNRDSLKKKQGRRERGGERKKRRGKRRGPRGEEAEQPLSFWLPACGHPSRVTLRAAAALKSAKLLEWPLHRRGPLCSHGHLPDERVQYQFRATVPFWSVQRRPCWCVSSLQYENITGCGG